MNTIFNIKRILIQYAEKQKFEFQSVLTNKQAINELVSTMQEIQMFAKYGMDAKKIMHIITGVNDELIKEQPLDIQQLQDIQNQIRKFKYEKEPDAYTLVHNLISTLGAKNE